MCPTQVRLGLGHRVGRLATLDALRVRLTGGWEADEPVDARMLGGENAEQHFFTLRSADVLHNLRFRDARSI